MARFDKDPYGFGQLLRSTEVQAGCVAIATTEELPWLIAHTPVESGETVATSHVEPADFGDRKGAVLVQDGQAVRQHFGNARTVATHYATRGR